jgi:hypothetical protein
MFGLLGTLLCVGLGVCLLGRLCWRPAKFAFLALTGLGVVSVLAGLGVFSGHHNANWVHQQRWDWDRSRDVFAVSHDPPRGREIDEWMPVPHVEAEQHVPKGAMVALGTVLIIAGWMLVRRERTQPIALKAFTLLGLAAGAVVLVSFFNTSPSLSHRIRDRVARDVVVRDVTIPAPVVIARSRPDSPDRPLRPDRTKVQKRSHAKRPASRPERNESTEELLAKMPPRAGTIPVDQELQDRPAAPDAPAPADAKAEPQPAPAAEPAPAVAEAAAAETAPPAADEPAAKSEPDAPDAEAAPQPAQPAPEPANVAEAAAPAEADTPKAPEPSPPPAPPAAAPPVTPPPTTEPPTTEPPTTQRPASTQDRAHTDAPVVAPVILSNQPRPDWIDSAGRLDNSTYRVAVKSGLYVSVPECQRFLDQAIKHESDQYINDMIGDPEASRLVDISPRYLRDHVKKAEFNEIVQVSVGPMHQIHALLEFDDDARTAIKQRWRDAVVSQRLWYTGSAGALVLGLLGTLYGYLRLDLKTGGAQKGRLQLAATLAALIVAAAALLFRWVVPL